MNEDEKNMIDAELWEIKIKAVGLVIGFAIAFLGLIFSAYSLFAAEARLTPDGKIGFAMSKVDGEPVYSQKEENDLVNSKQLNGKPGKVQKVTVSQFETILSTVGQFHVYQDFITAKTKTGLVDQAVKIYQRIQVLKAVNDTNELPDLQQRYDWLLSEAKKL